MQKILINKDGYVASPYTLDATIEVEVSEVDYEQISSFPFYTNWRYKDGKFILESIQSIEILKERRQKECFNLVDNRSPMWYKRLTQEQSKELDTWYQAWLDVTDTKVIPTKPSWL